MSLNDFLISPIFDHVLLTKELVLFPLFLLAIRFLPSLARNLTILLTSLALIVIATSPLYTFLFVATVSLLYFGLHRLQSSPRKKNLCDGLAILMVVLFFLLLDLPALRSPWTGQMVHRFGIAYSLFRLLSVVLDVGQGKPLPANPLDFFVYAFFLPTFFQGPIERLDEFRNNLAGRLSLNWSETGKNLIRIIGAFVKGWVVMRYLELDWKRYFDYPQGLSYSMLVWGMYARAIGFYLFVSAANDLTIACSAIAGYRINENYDYPYFKRNLAQFWRSWHMTLVRFLRDYVYLPLGGNRRHVFLNYLVIFLGVALWHVTSTAFVIWGLWHGLGMCLLKKWQDFWASVEEANRPGLVNSLQKWARRHPKMVTAVSTLVTFHFVALGWLPFWGGHPQGVGMAVRLLTGNHLTLFEWAPP